MSMNALLDVYIFCVPGDLGGPEEGIESSGTGVTNH